MRISNPKKNKRETVWKNLADERRKMAQFFTACKKGGIRTQTRRTRQFTSSC